jgi:hypothetical protein
MTRTRTLQEDDVDLTVESRLDGELSAIIKGITLPEVWLLLEAGSLMGHQWQ